MLNDEIFVYAPDSKYSGKYETNFTIGNAKQVGILDESVFEELDLKTGELIINIPPDETIMEFNWFLPNTQSMIQKTHSETESKFNETKTKNQILSEFAKCPKDITDVMEYLPRGFANETQILYATKEQREDFLSWLGKQPTNRILFHRWSLNWHFLDTLILLIKRNRQLNEAEPNSDYGTTLIPWHEFYGGN